MTINELYEYVKKEAPQIIHISGKTSVGKTTLSNQLVKDIDYQVIRLDNIVLKYVTSNFKISDKGQVFVEVYKNRTRSDWIQSFIQGAHEEIGDALIKNKKVIIDGAIANVETLKELIEIFPSCVIVYLHPDNLNIYQRNLTNRFTSSTVNDGAGLPSRFWKFFGEKDLSQFYADRIITQNIIKSIEEYAKESQIASTERLDAIKSEFKDVFVVNI